MKPIVKHLFIPLIILGIGGAGIAKFALRKETVETIEPIAHVVPVSVITVQPENHPILIPATGVVEAEQIWPVQPEISGRIRFRHADFSPGKRIKAGVEILSLDPAEYLIVRDQEQGRVTTAKAQLTIEKGRQRVAEKDWKLFEQSSAPGKTALALRKPHLASVQGQLTTAIAGLSRAELNLKRTHLITPFSGVVISENVALGQWITPGVTLGRIMATERFRIRVSLPHGTLDHIRFSDEKSGQTGSTVTIDRDAGSGEILNRTATVTHRLPEMEANGRRPQILVEIDNPFDPPKDGKTIHANALVEMTIQGKTLDHSFKLPHEAVREGHYIWVVNADNRIEKRLIDIAWRHHDYLLATGNITAGERVVVSSLSQAVNGVDVRIIEGDEVEKP
ncbi:MAG: efflux RND transporter periplasmic adaptor subunit [Magnetococcales bacterium]|nr:efflux RND transporter periplasmic adaptor subunit [Magnetococcales bacterium]